MTNNPEDDRAVFLSDVEREMARQQTLSAAKIVIALSSVLSVAAIVIGAMFIVFAISQGTGESKVAAATGLASIALFLTLMQLARVIGSYIGYQVRKDK